MIFYIIIKQIKDFPKKTSKYFSLQQKTKWIAQETKMDRNSYAPLSTTGGDGEHTQKSVRFST
jgi:hypothetical protein